MSFERTTPCGVISGTACQWPGIAAYKGIRYATAGRWEFPVPVTHWDGVYDATQYGACCYQPRAFYDEAAAPGKAFYYNEFRKGETYTYSEDCLFLNIWAPADAAPEDKLPVIFYIHGGGFTGGCGHEKHFDGPVWPTKGCVAVTINYRLGPMGFVCLPELAEEAGSAGGPAVGACQYRCLWRRSQQHHYHGPERRCHERPAARPLPHHQGAVLQGRDEQRRRREPDADGQAR